MEKSNDKRPRVVVVGSSNTDMVVVVPQIPRPGETVLGTGSMIATPGGKGANQAVAAARLGADVIFIARVGDDDLGQRARLGFHEDGIDTTHVQVTHGAASGVALIAVTAEGGENSIAVAPGANAHLSPNDVEAAETAIAQAQAVILSLEIPLETVRRTLEIASAYNVPTTLNPAPARSLPPSLLRQVTYLTPNEQEAHSLASSLLQRTDSSPRGAADTLRTAGVESVIVTLGAGGALVVTRDGEALVPAFAVSAIDTIAAGDCFTSALTVELASGRTLSDAVLFANAAAAVKVTRQGAQAGLPHRNDVLRFIDRQV